MASTPAMEPATAKSPGMEPAASKSPAMEAICSAAKSACSGTRCAAPTPTGAVPAPTVMTAVVTATVKSATVISEAKVARPKEAPAKRAIEKIVIRPKAIKAPSRIPIPVRARGCIVTGAAGRGAAGLRFVFAAGFAPDVERLGFNRLDLKSALLQRMFTGKQHLVMFAERSRPAPCPNRRFSIQNHHSLLDRIKFVEPIFLDLRRRAVHYDGEVRAHDQLVNLQDGRAAHELDLRGCQTPRNYLGFAIVSKTKKGARCEQYLHVAFAGIKRVSRPQLCCADRLR